MDAQDTDNEKYAPTAFDSLQQTCKSPHIPFEDLLLRGKSIFCPTFYLLPQPMLWPSLKAYPNDLLFALGAGWSEELCVAALAVNFFTFRYVAYFSKGLLTAAAAKLVLVPRAAFCNQKRASVQKEAPKYIY